MPRYFPDTPIKKRQKELASKPSRYHNLVRIHDSVYKKDAVVHLSYQSQLANRKCLNGHELDPKAPPCNKCQRNAACELCFNAIPTLPDDYRPPKDISAAVLNPVELEKLCAYFLHGDDVLGTFSPTCGQCNEIVRKKFAIFKGAAHTTARNMMHLRTVTDEVSVTNRKATLDREYRNYMAWAEVMHEICPNEMCSVTELREILHREYFEVSGADKEIKLFDDKYQQKVKEIRATHASSAFTRATKIEMIDAIDKQAIRFQTAAYEYNSIVEARAYKQHMENYRGFIAQCYGIRADQMTTCECCGAEDSAVWSLTVQWTNLDALQFLAEYPNNPSDFGMNNLSVLSQLRCAAASRFFGIDINSRDVSAFCFACQDMIDTCLIPYLPRTITAKERRLE